MLWLRAHVRSTDRTTSDSRPTIWSVEIFDETAARPPAAATTRQAAGAIAEGVVRQRRLGSGVEVIMASSTRRLCGGIHPFEVRKRICNVP